MAHLSVFRSRTLAAGSLPQSPHNKQMSAAEFHSSEWLQLINKASSHYFLELLTSFWNYVIQPTSTCDYAKSKIITSCFLDFDQISFVGLGVRSGRLQVMILLACF